MTGRSNRRVSRRAVLAATGAAITGSILTPTVGATPPDEPILTTDGARNDDVFTDGDELQRDDLDDPSDWTYLEHSPDEHTVYIWYRGDEYRADAERAAEHVTAAQNHVHKYLEPPADHEAQYFLIPVDEYDRKPSSAGAQIHGDEDRVSGDVRVEMQTVPPSEHPHVTTTTGIDDVFLDAVISAYWRVPAYHAIYVRYNHSTDHEAVTPRWLRRGMERYVASTVQSDSAPYATGAARQAGEEIARTGTVDWDAVNDVEQEPYGYTVGLLAVEFMVEEWDYEPTLDVYLHGDTFDNSIEELLGVTRSEFNAAFIDYIENTYGTETPEQTPPGTPEQTPGEDPGQGTDEDPTTEQPGDWETEIVPGNNDDSDTDADDDDGFPWWVIGAGAGVTGGAAYYKYRDGDSDAPATDTPSDTDRVDDTGTDTDDQGSNNNPQS